MTPIITNFNDLLDTRTATSDDFLKLYEMLNKLWAITVYNQEVSVEINNFATKKKHIYYFERREITQPYVFLEFIGKD